MKELYKMTAKELAKVLTTEFTSINGKVGDAATAEWFKWIRRNGKDWAVDVILSKRNM